MNKVEMFDAWWKKEYVHLALGYKNQCDVRTGFFAALELVECKKPTQPACPQCPAEKCANYPESCSRCRHGTTCYAD